MEQAIRQKNQNVIIVNGKHWHLGVLGIVASRLVEKFNKPSIVISFHNEKGIGSARSIKSINLGDIIIDAKNEGLLIKGGGHKMAAGLTISMNKYSYFYKYIVELLNNYDSSYFQKILYFDSVLTLDEINLDLIKNIEKLEPFGHDNPYPKFIIHNVSLQFAKISKEKHVLLSLKDRKDKLLRGISFNCADNALGQNLLNNKSKKFDLGCSIKKDIYKGNNQPQLVIHDAMVMN